MSQSKVRPFLARRDIKGLHCGTAYAIHYLPAINGPTKRNETMPTQLTKPVSRETAKTIGKRSVILTIAPAGGSQREALIGVRLKGTRTEYVVALSDLYRTAALWYGQKVAKAKREARRAGIPWRLAKRRFDRENRIAAALPEHSADDTETGQTVSTADQERDTATSAQAEK